MQSNVDDAITTKVRTYTPKRPLPDNLLADLKRLVAAVRPTNMQDANALLSNGCKYLHDHATLWDRPLSEIITHARIEAWCSYQRAARHDRTVANERGRLRALADATIGAARSPRLSQDPRPFRKLLDQRWHDALNDPTAPAAVRATLLAALGCGLHSAANATIRGDRVELDDGAVHMMRPGVAHLAAALDGVVIPADGWTQAATHAGIAAAPSETAVRGDYQQAIAALHLPLAVLMVRYGLHPDTLNRIPTTEPADDDLAPLRG